MKSIKKPKSWQENERQQTRDRATGKYEKLNACEICGKSATAEYWSHEMCNEWGGIGLILCKKCYGKTEAITDKKEFKKLLR